MLASEVARLRECGASEDNISLAPLILSFSPWEKGRPNNSGGHKYISHQGHSKNPAGYECDDPITILAVIFSCLRHGHAS